jgi:hypothetical protein
MKLQKILPLILGLTMLSTACSPTQPSAAPTANATQLDAIVQAVQTSVAATNAAKATAVPPATQTPYPTYTPYPTFTTAPTSVVVAPTIPVATVKPTIIPWTLTPTATPAAYACSVLSVSPSSGSSIAKGSDFDGTFTVQNTGTAQWVSSDMDVVYISGQDSMIKHKAYDMKTSVNAGQSTTFTVDLTAPSDSGSYSVEFELRGGSTFCPMTVSIVTK